MAEIYRAKAIGDEDGPDVAIKRPLPTYNADNDFIVMLMDEARITRRFDHPNLAKVYEFGVVDGQHFLAMEFVDGSDFRGLLRRFAERGQRCPLDVGTYVVQEALAGLHAAHEQQDENGAPLEVIHRDVTPSNILIGYGGEVKLTDFGIAKTRWTRSRTQAGFVKGKVKYMSPEQARKEGLDRRTDLFSAGVVLYYAVTGLHPFRGNNEAAVMDAVRRCDYRPASQLNPNLDGAFDEVIRRALATSRDDRFETAFEFRKTLADWRLNHLGDQPSKLQKVVRQLFAAEKQEEEALYHSFHHDDDPTPTFERQSYTRLVGVEDERP